MDAEVELKGIGAKVVVQHYREGGEAPDGPVVRWMM